LLSTYSKAHHLTDQTCMTGCSHQFPALALTSGMQYPRSEKCSTLVVKKCPGVFTTAVPLWGQGLLMRTCVPTLPIRDLLRGKRTCFRRRMAADTKAVTESYDGGTPARPSAIVAGHGVHEIAPGSLICLKLLVTARPCEVCQRWSQKWHPVLRRGIGFCGQS